MVFCLFGCGGAVASGLGLCVVTVRLVGFPVCVCLFCGCAACGFGGWGAFFCFRATQFRVGFGCLLFC